MHDRSLLHRIALGLTLLLWPLALAGQERSLRDRGPQPSTRPATTRSTEDRREQERRRLTFLSRRGVELIKEKRFAEAEKTLAEAILMAPTHSTNLYNMACVKALQGHQQAAMDYLERAAGAGFTDFIHIERDADLVNLRLLDRYKGLIARKGEFQRRAAERVVEWLKRELGEGYRFEVDTANKLVFATNTDAATLESLRSGLLKQARSQWAMLFSHKPDQYISVVIPSAEDYRRIVRQPGVGGFYNHDERILIARQMGQVMTHEFTHALHNADLDPLAQEHAIWVGEGLGAMFEAATYDENGALIPADNFRLAFLQPAARTNRLVPLEKLFAMEQKDFVANRTVNLTYGQSGSVLLYLYEQGLLKAFYDTYKETFEQDKTGRAALEKVAGKPLADFESEWKAWMLNRKPPAMTTGPQGAFLGVRFDDANDGLRVMLVIPDGAAHAAGIRAGDVIVGLNGTDVRDQRSFMPMLSAFKPGEEVRLKVRRGSDYLDVALKLGARDSLTRRRVR